MSSGIDSQLERQFDAVFARREALVPALDSLAAEMPAGRLRNEIRRLAALLGRARSRADLSGSKIAWRWLPLLTGGFAAEASTQHLGDMLERASRESQNRRRRRRALGYPLALALFALGIFAFLCVLVVPTFSSMFQEFGMQLPISTRIVVFVSDQLVQHPVRCALMVALTSVTIYGAVRLWTHFALTTRLLGTFVAGNSASVNAMSSVTGRLADVLSLDVELPDALWIAGEGCQHFHYQGVMKRLARWARDEARPLIQSPDARQLPGNVIQALESPTGDGPNVALLRELSAMYGERADRRVDWLTTASAQLAILAVGIATVVVVIALFAPMFVMVHSLS